MIEKNSTIKEKANTEDKLKDYKEWWNTPWWDSKDYIKPLEKYSNLSKKDILFALDGIKKYGNIIAILVITSYFTISLEGINKRVNEKIVVFNKAFQYDISVDLIEVLKKL